MTVCVHLSKRESVVNSVLFNCNISKYVYNLFFFLLVTFVPGILQDYIKPFNQTRGLVYFFQDAPEPYF